MPTTAVQVDDQNFTPTTPQFIAQMCSDGDTIFLAWDETAAAGVPARRICFRRYEIASSTLSSVIEVAPSLAWYPSMVLLDNGRLVIIYQDGSAVGKVWGRESLDRGNTWSAPVEIDGLATNAVGPLVSDGVNVYGYLSRSTDCWEFQRTGVRVWTAAAKIFDGVSDNTFAFSKNAPRSAFVRSDGVRAVLVNRLGPGSFSTLKVNSFFYNGISWGDVNIFTNAVAGNKNPKVHLGNDNIARGVFIDNVTQDAHLIRSTDGLAWTDLGTPSALDVYNWDTSYPHAVAADARNIWFLATTVVAAGTYLDIYQGTDSLSGWVRVERFTVPWTTASNGCGDGIFIGKDFFYLGSFVDSGKYHLFLAKTPSIGSDPVVPDTPAYESRRMFQRGTLRLESLPDGAPCVPSIESAYEAEPVLEG